MLSVRFVVTILLTTVLLGGPHSISWGKPPPREKPAVLQGFDRGIWDGRYTNAKSGLGVTLPDAGSSEGERGTDDPPFKFYAPTFQELNLYYDEVDRDDIANSFRVRDYSRAALVQLRRDLTVYGQPIPKGYYHVELGDFYSGSERFNLGYYQTPLPPEVAKDRKDGKLKLPTAVVFKRQGRVVAVAPIARMAAYKPTKDQLKVKRHQVVAVLEDGPHHPLLELYTKKKVYYVELIPDPIIVQAPPKPAPVSLPPLQPLATPTNGLMQ